MPIHEMLRLKICKVLGLTLLIFSLIATPMIYAAETKVNPTGPTNAKEVEKFADQFFNRPKIKEKLTGAAFVVVKDDQVLFKKGYGYADLEKKRPVDPDSTVFRIASISKIFTSTAAMQLVEQNKLDLNKDIQEYLKDFNLNNKTGKKLTLDHLMSHMTGFEYTDLPSMDTESPNKYYPLDEFVKQNAPSIVSNPGEVFRYDNYAFVLLGYIVQSMTGVPFHQYVENHIFKPLGMNSSSFIMRPDIHANLATPYDGAKKPIPEYGSIPTDAPDGSMLSTAGDMAKFMIAHLNGGKLAGKQILQEKTAKTMHQVRHNLHPKIQNGAYGFETFFQNHYNQQAVIGKGGDLPGYHSWMWLLPEKKVGGFVVFNGDGANFREELFKAFMDHYYPKPVEDKVDVQTTKKGLQRFVGVYQDLRSPYWVFRVNVLDDGQLMVKDPLGNHKFRQKDPFLFEDEQGMKAAFKVNPNGSVDYFYYNKVDSWAQKRPEPKPYSDVAKDHEFAKYIYDAKQLGYLVETPDNKFHPEKPITRGEFIAQLLRVIGVPPSKKPPMFKDLPGNEYAGEIQSALDYGLVEKPNHQRIEPNRPITREEAAILVWRVANKKQVPPSAKVSLSGKTDSWAMDGVNYVVSKGLYGPEVKPNSRGEIDYKSKQPMLRQEAAALISLFAQRFVSSE
ncbi:serine hydrolase [Brevibacillus sp. 7WMA2]|uniref:serine hydrolase n=1 Tax=Brevibacillus sp. 7WMA2 TaxID=2683193 RepID=UPI0013A781F5|nr:serine hydrolase [Brevibacillus sp. 7WMA2]QIC07792.1 serine hydrolase [Brevibacillus sp. 7WMA2]WPS88773.1 serine hydrolase [Brevibacillus halotolerans]